MHRLAALPGLPEDPGSDGQLAYVEQPPAPVLLLSSADTDLVAFADLLARQPDLLGVEARALNLAALAHPALIDHYLASTVRHARLVLVRLLGGRGHWSYGLEQLQGWARQTAAAGGVRQLLVLSGTPDLDAELAGLGTVQPALAIALAGCLRVGGADNLAAVLRSLAALLAGEQPDPPSVVPAPDPLPHDWREQSGARVGVLLYRALHQAGDSELMQAVLAALRARGLCPRGLWVSSLRDEAVQKGVADLLRRERVEAVLCGTGFASVSFEEAGLGAPLWERLAVPVLQLLTSGRPRREWQSSSIGLGPLDLSLQVALPELDGRIGTRVGAFKEVVELEAHPGLQATPPLSPAAADPARADGARGLQQRPEGECRDPGLPSSSEEVTANALSALQPAAPGSTAGSRERRQAAAAPGLATALQRLRPDRERLDWIAALTEAWIRLRRTRPEQRRVALVLANYPTRNSRLANGVGLDTPASTAAMLQWLRQAGYDLGDAPLPADGEALIQALLSGRSNDPESGHRPALAQLPLQVYQDWYGPLPQEGRQRLEAVWGSPTQDAGLEDGASGRGFPVRGLRFGNVAVLIQPERGYDRDPSLSYHSPDLPPTHAYLAQYLWLRQVFGAHVVVHVGKHGNLEWLPGKGVGLSQDCFPEWALGPLPHLYPFIVNDPGEGSQAKRRAQAVILDHLTPPLGRAGLHGELQALEGLLDEYWEARSLGGERAAGLRQQLARELDRLQLPALNRPEQSQRDAATPPQDTPADGAAYAGQGERPKASSRSGGPDTGGGTPGTAAGRNAPSTVDNDPSGQGGQSGGDPHPDLDARLDAADGYLCEIKEAQIRLGLHRYGSLPEPGALAELLLCLARPPQAGLCGLTQALARDLGLRLDPWADPEEQPLHEDDWQPLAALPAVDPPAVAISLGAAGSTGQRPRLNEGPGTALQTTPAGSGAGRTPEPIGETGATACPIPEASGVQRAVSMASGGAGRAAGLRRCGDGTARLEAWALQLMRSELARAASEGPDAASGQPKASGQAGLPPGEMFEPATAATAVPETDQRGDQAANSPAGQGLVAGSGSAACEAFASGDGAADDNAPDPVQWPPVGPQSEAVLQHVRSRLLPALLACGEAERLAFLTGLEGGRIAAGPSGAPTRGRPDLLPTGRNFYSVDLRGLPTEAAWDLGRRSAELLLDLHRLEQGEELRSLALSVWGTATMRNGGEDIAQALALMGVRPVWDGPTRRMVDLEVIPLSVLGRPRVDVTLRISGLFRDAFPQLVGWINRATRLVAALSGEGDANPLAQAAQAEGHCGRVFGSAPGAYGAGLQGLIDSGQWDNRADLASAFLNWSQWRYDGEMLAGGSSLVAAPGPEGGQGNSLEARLDRRGLERRLARVQVVLHNQDNREHDLLDSDDYYQFHGGLSAAVETLSGERPQLWFGDHSRSARPRLHRVEKEFDKVLRSRLLNPRWIEAMQAHGYKGGFEMAASLDYLFAYDASSGRVPDWSYGALSQSWLNDERVLAFLRRHNPWALRDMAERLLEAQQRGLWEGAADSEIERLRQLVLESEALVETG